MSNLAIVLLILVVVLLASGMHPDLGYTRTYYGGGGLGLVFIILLILIVAGRI